MLNDYQIIFNRKELVKIKNDQNSKGTHNFPRGEISSLKISPDIASIIPGYLALKHKVLPIKISGDKLILAMADPNNILAIDDVKMITGLDIDIEVVSQEELDREIKGIFGLKRSVEKAIEQLEKPEELKSKAKEEKDEFYEYAEGPAIKIVDHLVYEAVKQEASDIHIDPRENEIWIRFRIDGILQNVISFSKHAENNLISRIKVIAGMDIANKRTPQDGRMSYELDNYKIDIRVSIVPTIFGEKTVLRLLYTNKVIIPLDKLGFQSLQYSEYHETIKKSTGMILITGPTGCGKTTTLYSTLTHLNSSEKNIITIEDPVEFQLDKVNQIQIEEKAGVTFADGLRAILRQDPDIIMIGEIRDLETARIAIRSALTGHLVFATLHTNSVISALFRFLDMGIASHLIAPSVEAVVSQRLIRLACKYCKINYEPSENELIIFRKYTANSNFNDFTKGRGCKSCNNTGYKGRKAVFETLILNEELRELLLKHVSLTDFAKKAKETGYIPMIQNAFKDVENQVTTLEEAIKVEF